MNPLPILPGLESAKTPPSPASPAKPPTGKPPPIAFQVLLERLREQARVLEDTTKEPLSAKELPGAVHVAQASMQDALKIAEGLVEAFRSSQLHRK